MQLSTILPAALFALRVNAAVNGHCTGSANVRGCVSTFLNSHNIFDGPGLLTHVIELQLTISIV
jgi:hypothetical protein